MCMDNVLGYNENYSKQNLLKLVTIERTTRAKAKCAWAKMGFSELFERKLFSSDFCFDLQGGQISNDVLTCFDQCWKDLLPSRSNLSF